MKNNNNIEQISFLVVGAVSLVLLSVSSSNAVSLGWLVLPALMGLQLIGSISKDTNVYWSIAAVAGMMIFGVFGVDLNPVAVVIAFVYLVLPFHETENNWLGLLQNFNKRPWLLPVSVATWGIVVSVSIAVAGSEFTTLQTITISLLTFFFGMTLKTWTSVVVNRYNSSKTST